MKKVIIAIEIRDAPDVIIGTITICMDPAKMKNAEAVDSNTPYPASLMRIPKAMPINR